MAENKLLDHEFPEQTLTLTAYEVWVLSVALGAAKGLTASELYPDLQLGPNDAAGGLRQMFLDQMRDAEYRRTFLRLDKRVEAVLGPIYALLEDDEDDDDEDDDQGRLTGT